MVRYYAVTRGFSLVESLVAISIVAILAAIALPNFRTTISSTQVNSLATMLYRDLKLAQAEAIRQGKPIGLYASSNAADWSGGWYVADALGGTRIVNRDAPDSRYLVAASMGDGSSGPAIPVAAVVFRPMGDVVGATSRISFSTCEKNNAASAQQQILVNPSGGVMTFALPNAAASATGCGT